MDITRIITALLELVIAFFTVVGSYVLKQYVIPWISSKFSEQELQSAQDFIAYMIKAAEQLEKNGTFSDVEEVGKAKKAYVLAQVKLYCEQHGFTFDEDTISNLIESLIQEIKYSE